MTADAQPSPTRCIRRIYVEGLFGQFVHDLHFGNDVPSNPNLLILYGENGTGKTTLLWLVYHLLNREGKRGHRTYLARHQFKKLSVTFDDGLEIVAERPQATVGSFELKLHQEATLLAMLVYTPDKTGRIPSTVSDEASHVEFSAKLPEFNFGFLPHDRSTKPASELRHGPTEHVRVVPAETPIRRSISRAIGTARQQAIRASNQGQLTANAIYTELVQQIAQVPLTAPESGVEEGRLKLLDRLRDQARETLDYSKFGLISELQVAGFLDTLKSMPGSRFVIVDQVLEPFLRGNDARLNALRALYIALTTTVESVNSLYLNKRITLHLERGLHIATLLGESLESEQLSSGEQELLILFCEVISALRPNTILFIDEPELSLNVSWQRKLLDALLRCASGSSVQFVIATHSIELLAQHRPNVTRLSTEVIGRSKPVPSDEQVGE